MDDERLLSEALRAHAAGGVSTPSSSPGSASGAPATDGRTPDGPSKGRPRFRPLRRGRSASADEARPGPAPGSAAPGTPGPGPVAAGPVAAAPPRPGPASSGRSVSMQGPGRPTPPPGIPAGGAQRMPPAPGSAPIQGQQYLGGGPLHPSGGAGGTGPSPRPDAGAWPATRIAWWSAVAVLGGGVLGGVLAVISLAAPG